MKEVVVGYGEFLPNPKVKLENALSEARSTMNAGLTTSEKAEIYLKNLAFAINRRLKGRSVAPRIVMNELAFLGVHPIDLIAAIEFTRGYSFNLSNMLFPSLTTEGSMRLNSVDYANMVTKMISWCDNLHGLSNLEEKYLFGLSAGSRLMGSLVAVNSNSSVFLNMNNIESLFADWMSECLQMNSPTHYNNVKKGLDLILNFKETPPHLMNTSVAKRLIQIAVDKITSNEIPRHEYLDILTKLELKNILSTNYFNTNDCLNIASIYISKGSEDLSTLAGNFVFMRNMDFLKFARNLGMSEKIIHKVLYKSIKEIFSIPRQYNYMDILGEAYKTFDCNYCSASNSEKDSFFTPGVLEALSVNFDAFKHYRSAGIINTKNLMREISVFRYCSGNDMANDGVASYEILMKEKLTSIIKDVVYAFGYRHDANIFATKESLDRLELTGHIKTYRVHSEGINFDRYKLIVVKSENQLDSKEFCLNHNLE